MKAILCAVIILLFITPTITQSQSLKKFEKKAKKAFKKEAYGMTLYYSQAILKINGDHPEALHWAALSSLKLQLDKNPAYFFKKPSTLNSQPVPKKVTAENEINVSQPLTLIVQTFNAVDSTDLKGTYIGLTNDGFGKGVFVQNNEFENTAIFKISKDEFFTVTGTKNSFLAGSATISISDNITPDTIYRKLYLAPAWGLPLNLYFDHSKPKAIGSSDTLTILTYEQTWIDYLFRIDDYIEGNAADTSATAKAKAQSEIGLFFANHIDANFHQLESLCELLSHLFKSWKKNNIEDRRICQPI